MTPGARISGATEVLDRILAGTRAEVALTNWGRANRFAGSGDRAAIRDHVFAALRCRRSFAALGGAETGRGLMLGALRATGTDPATLFTGEGHAPPPPGPGDSGRAPGELEALDCPDWLAPLLGAALGPDFAPVLLALRHRAPVFLRVNSARISREDAIERLGAEDIAARPHPLAETALEVTSGERRIQTAQAYAQGLVELQDASSQAVVMALPLANGQRVLDYCAGGGGKTLAMAARARLRIEAHDAAPHRMRDLPARAKRAGVAVSLTEAPRGPFDLVLTDVPCSGSGSWRRDPEGKWALTPQRLADLLAIQAEVMDRAAALVVPGGTLAYATCSLLAEENESQVSAFLARQRGWTCAGQRRFTPLSGGDGFFLALLTRS